MATDTYHHGNLRQALLRTAVAAIAESGPGALSLRELARRAGVSHAAPAHHFGDKAGLLTAVAAEGYELLAESLQQTAERTGSFVEVGVAYVRFAIERRGHFEVMFRPDQLHRDDPALTQARERARGALWGSLADLQGIRAQSRPEVPLAAWTLVHGFATLWLSGSLPDTLGDDPGVAARTVAKVLFE